MFKWQIWLLTGSFWTWKYFTEKKNFTVSTLQHCWIPMAMSVLFHYINWTLHITGWRHLYLWSVLYIFPSFPLIGVSAKVRGMKLCSFLTVYVSEILCAHLPNSIINLPQTSNNGRHLLDMILEEGIFVSLLLIELNPYLPTLETNSKMWGSGVWWTGLV